MLSTFYKNKYAAVAAFIIFVFAFGIWRTDNSLQKVSQAESVGKNIEGNVVTIKSSDSIFGQNLIVEFENEIKILLQVPAYPKFKYGDVLKIKCELKIIENKNSDFDYRMYMAKDEVLYKCEESKFEKISENGGSKILGYVLKLRDKFDGNIIRSIPMPEGALASGILLGGTKGLSEEIQNDFSRTGMTHIVAVSGYNVTIIAEYLILIGIFIGLWRKQAIWFALFGIAIFVIMIGMPASAVRAGVMSSVLLWAIKNGRLSSSENAIIFAGFIMLMINPLLLRWDVGFQLSMFATLGIVLTSELWEKSFIKKHKTFGISEIIALSLSAQVFVLPIIAYNFGKISLISLLANVLILPIVPISMLLVFLVAIFDFIFPLLAIIFSWLSFIALHYEIEIIKLLSDFPRASADINFNGYAVFFYYFILIVLLIKYRKMQNANLKMQNDK